MTRILLAMARMEALPVDLLRRLLQHPEARREAARSRRDLTEALAKEIIALGSARSLAANSAIPLRIRALLARHPEEAVRAATAAVSEDNPPGLLAALASDPCSLVRAFLAMNESAPPGVLADLASDPDPYVRSMLARHWRGAPESVQRTLFTDPVADVRVAACATYAPPADLIEALLSDPHTRAAVVHHLDLDLSLATELATDPDADIRIAVATHPDLPVALRDRLADDTDPFVRMAANPRNKPPRREDPIQERVAQDEAAARLSREEMEQLLTRAGL